MRKNSIVVGRILSGSCVGKTKNVDFFLSKNALLDFWERHIPSVERSLLETHKSPCPVLVPIPLFLRNSMQKEGDEAAPVLFLDGHS